MGVDTKGCVVTKEKDVFKVASVIDRWWRTLRKNEGFRPLQKVEGWASPRIEVNGSTNSLSAYFQFKGEDRHLFIPLDCDCDLTNHEEIEGKSCIWFSLGCWGSSVELMQSLMGAFKAEEWVDACYIDESDCDEEGFIQV